MSNNGTSSTASQRNSSNKSYTERPYRVASLLVHPCGVQVLEKYKDMLEAPQDETDGKVNTFANEMEEVINGIEPAISKRLRQCVIKHWAADNNTNCFVTGERQEPCSGMIDQEEVNGKPDFVLRIDIEGLNDMVKNNDEKKKKKEQEQEEEKTNNTKLGSTKGKAAAIIEVSLNANGGEKKISQGFEYATLMEDTPEVILLLTLHFDCVYEGPNPESNPESLNEGKVAQEGNTSSNPKPSKQLKQLQVSQEAFIFKNKKEEKKNKLGFLWRECCNAQKEDEVNATIRKSCEGIIRFLECAKELNSLLQQTTKKTAWNVVGDNVAIKGEQYVYKIFDNRFYPTQRKWQNWFSKEQSDKHVWLENLNVNKRFEFQETRNGYKDFTDYLGHPKELLKAFKENMREFEEDKPSNKRQRSFRGTTPEFLRSTPYGWGSVVIIQYDYQDGTQFASKVSHFQKIAQVIQQMHAKDIVHGDVRAFNMLHPTEKQTGIKESCLIDFDFSGKPGEDKYPLGFNELINDRRGSRPGSAGQPLQKSHDWIELAAAMENFFPGDVVTSETIDAWNDLLMQLFKVSDSTHPVEWFDDFKDKYGDKLKPYGTTEEEWDKILNKGTGSPYKKQREARGYIESGENAAHMASNR